MYYTITIGDEFMSISPKDVLNKNKKIIKEAHANDIISFKVHKKIFKDHQISFQKMVRNLKLKKY